MAISETALKETELMTIADINAKGGVLGKQLEPVVVDPASNWPLFAEKASQLLTQDKVAVVFGCWTSVSRKSVLPVFKELNGLLFYPVQYEGEELEKNMFYTGAAPNQQAIPVVEYLMSEDGGVAKRFVLLGTDYVYPRTNNKILRVFLKSKGVAELDIMEDYTPFGHSDYQTIIANIKKFAGEGKKNCVISTINGDSNVPFYKELGNAGLMATDVPVVAFSVGEEELFCYAIVAVAFDLIWGYAEILSLGRGIFFALGGYAFGMYLMRIIGQDGSYHSNLPDFMVFLNWKALPWYWIGSDYFLWSIFLVLTVPALLALVFGFFAFRSRIRGV
jgi:ABC-type branched-subunit amino acid transport system substrate-binding protein